MTVGDVYFAQAEAGPIKIGYSLNVPARMAQLQNGMQQLMTVLTTVEGDRRSEAYFHQRFKEHRLKGEWFRPHTDIFLCVEDVKRRGVLAIPRDFRAYPEYLPTRAEAHEFLVACKDYCVEIAGPRAPHEKTIDLIDRVARLTGLTRRKVYSIWYFQKVSIYAEDYLALKDLFEAKQAAEQNKHDMVTLAQEMLRRAVVSGDAGDVGRAVAGHLGGSHDRR